MYDLSMGNRMENLHFTVERMKQMGNDFMEFQSFNMIFFIVFGLIAIVMIMGIVKTIGAGLSNQAMNGYNVHVRLWINGRECVGDQAIFQLRHIIISPLSLTGVSVWSWR